MKTYVKGASLEPLRYSFDTVDVPIMLELMNLCSRHYAHEGRGSEGEERRRYMDLLVRVGLARATLESGGLVVAVQEEVEGVFDAIDHFGEEYALLPSVELPETEASEPLRRRQDFARKAMEMLESAQIIPY